MDGNENGKQTFTFTLRLTFTPVLVLLLAQFVLVMGKQPKLPTSTNSCSGALVNKKNLEVARAVMLFFASYSFDFEFTCFKEERTPEKQPCSKIS